MVKNTLIASLIVIAAFLRLFKIDQYMTFLGDEGRDALIIKDLLVNGNIPFIGAPSSVGTIYLGPLYYYMMALSMAVWWLNPIAAAVMVALLGTACVYLIYYLTKEWFGFTSGIIAAGLYAISSVPIIYARSSWNPNPVPFFVLLAFLGIHKSFQKGNYRWLFLTGASLSALFQMHYLSLIIFPAVGFLWLVQYRHIRKSVSEVKKFLLSTFGAVILALLILLPWLLFDFKHNFLNIRGIIHLFTASESAVSVSFLSLLQKPAPIFYQSLINRYLTGEQVFLALFVSLLMILFLGWGLYKKRGKARWPFMILSAWLVSGLVMLTLYHNQIYDHYINSLSPIPFIIFGAFFASEAFALNTPFRFIKNIVLTVVLIIIVALNIQHNPLNVVPNRQLQKTQEIAKFIITKSENKPFNFALIARSNYDSAYQYYLDIYGHKAKQVPFEVTDQLFVVCEDNPCAPVGNSKYEIAAFGWTKEAEHYTLEGVQIYKLIPHPDQPK